MNIYYENILVGTIVTNNSMDIDSALELISFDEENFIAEHGFFDGIDYNDFHFDVSRANEITLKELNEKHEKLYTSSEFDETFDRFFDNKELRKKYNAWNYEEDSIDFEVSNGDLLETLDDKDMQSYIEFYKNYLSELEDKLNEV